MYAFHLLAFSFAALTAGLAGIQPNSTAAVGHCEGTPVIFVVWLFSAVTSVVLSNYITKYRSASTQVVIGFVVIAVFLSVML